MKNTNCFGVITAWLLIAVGTLFITTKAAAENLSLEAPSFRAAKLAQDGAPGNAFPADEAGIAAHAKVDQAIDIEEIALVFREVLEREDNYILGIVPVSNFGSGIDVHVYADVEGWLVAFLKKNEPAARIMQWRPANVNNPKILTIPRNTLTDALSEAGTAAGVGFLPKIKYYNFKSYTS